MKHLVGRLALGLLLAGAVAAFSGCGMMGGCMGGGGGGGHQHGSTEEKPAAPNPPAAAKKYTCPMHPQVVADKPGNCPICGMKLIEKAGE